MNLIYLISAERKCKAHLYSHLHTWNVWWRRRRETALLQEAFKKAKSSNSALEEALEMETAARAAVVEALQSEKSSTTESRQAGPPCFWSLGQTSGTRTGVAVLRSQGGSTHIWARKLWESKEATQEELSGLWEEAERAGNSQRETHWKVSSGRKISL